MDIATWDILKWVLLVLLAGFIGQFGKSFAQAVMAGIRKKKPEEKISSAALNSPKTCRSGGAGKTAGSPGTGAVEFRGYDGRSGLRFGCGQESLKALAKKQKKEAKLRSKLSK
jgi:hypothetical protein